MPSTRIWSVTGRTMPGRRVRYGTGRKAAPIVVHTSSPSATAKAMARRWGEVRAREEGGADRGAQGQPGGHREGEGPAVARAPGRGRHRGRPRGGWGGGRWGGGRGGGRGHQGSRRWPSASGDRGMLT